VIRNVNLGDGSPTDVLVVDGRIAAREPDLDAPEDAEIEDGDGCLLLPGLVNAHAHADKTLLGLPWHRNEGTATSIRGLVEHERRVLAGVDHDPERQSARFVRAAIAAGTTHIRTHVDVDDDLELRHAEALMRTRELFADEITIELVAFPQAGLIMPPGSSTLVETALSDGLDVVGGIDPTLVDRTAGGMISPASTIALTALAVRSRRRSSTKPAMEHDTTSNVTEMTVRITLFFVAVTSMLSRAETTSEMFSQMCHSVGHDRSRRAASARSLTAVRKIRPKGTTNTMVPRVSATASSQYLRTSLTRPAPDGAGTSSAGRRAVSPARTAPRCRRSTGRRTRPGTA
jgi:hypothetical protein